MVAGERFGLGAEGMSEALAVVWEVGVAHLLTVEEAIDAASVVQQP